ncbi:hypothetical protein HYFRA_00005143 [Hymenoscyphus fraxineus]|uniref:Uncharacterized protein n=1 Tax=Hymenoscyphus fraxineus TaxID=746836 RepID=A0A9N9LDC1_9HELO|nr:hypothetical protein HYFRA_00005143 [Hymenoscyphus fraxineus]
MDAVDTLPATIRHQPVQPLRYMRIGRTEEERRLHVARVRTWVADTRRILGLFPSFLQSWIKPIAGFYVMYRIVAAERKEQERLGSERLVLVALLWIEDRSCSGNSWQARTKFGFLDHAQAFLKRVPKVAPVIVLLLERNQHNGTLVILLQPAFQVPHILRSDAGKIGGRTSQWHRAHAVGIDILITKDGGCGDTLIKSRNRHRPFPPYTPLSPSYPPTVVEKRQGFMGFERALRALHTDVTGERPE